MNRRRILALLSGGAASLSSRFVSAADGNKASSIAKTNATAWGGDVRMTGACPDLKLAGLDRQVRSIGYSRGAYSVTTADGKSAAFLENDLRFKIDSSDLGPMIGKPVLVPSGAEGDRAWVIFSSPGEISASIKRRWS